MPTNPLPNPLPEGEGEKKNSTSMTDSWERGDYQISTDRSRLNLDLIHDFLSHKAYWATGRSLEVVERSIENSL